MNAIYNIGTRAYFFGIQIAATFGHRKARQMQEGRKDWATALEQKMRPLQGEKVIWFHAASLGEFEQGRPLIESLHTCYPEYRVVQTFFSPSGYEVRKNYKGADVICYLPYDKPADCRLFLDLVHPQIAIFVKYEFWGNMLGELRRRSIPAYLVSGIFRPRQAFFKWYGAFLRPVLHDFTHFFVQDDESKQLLSKLGYDNVTVSGDTRFDRVISIQQQAKQFDWAQSFSESASFVLVAGSSWPKDEDILLEHFNRTPSMKLIIAPHEIHEEHIQSIIAKLKRPYMRYTQLDESRLSETDCLIVDAIGFLSGIYRYGQVAYIGGGFGVGIHNTLEAAVYGIPVLFGPNHQAFREALGLIEAGGGFPIYSASDYETLMTKLAKEEDFRKKAGIAAGNYVKNNSGATHTIFSAIFGKSAADEV